MLWALDNLHIWCYDVVFFLYFNRLSLIRWYLKWRHIPPPVSALLMPYFTGANSPDPPSCSLLRTQTSHWVIFHSHHTAAFEKAHSKSIGVLYRALSLVSFTLFLYSNPRARRASQAFPEVQLTAWPRPSPCLLSPRQPSIPRA